MLRKENVVTWCVLFSDVLVLDALDMSSAPDKAPSISRSKESRSSAMLAIVKLQLQISYEAQRCFLLEPAKIFKISQVRTLGGLRLEENFSYLYLLTFRL